MSHDVNIRTDSFSKTFQQVITSCGAGVKGFRPLEKFHAGGDIFLNLRAAAIHVDFINTAYFQQSRQQVMTQRLSVSEWLDVLVWESLVVELDGNYCGCSCVRAQISPAIGNRQSAIGNRQIISRLSVVVNVYLTFLHGFINDKL